MIWGFVDLLTLTREFIPNGPSASGATGFRVGEVDCGSCRHWSASPVNAFSLWSPDAIRVTKGADRIGVYRKTALSHRKFCRSCGGHLFTAHPPWNLVDVYAAVIPDFVFKGKVHVNYQSTVLRMKDGLPKFSDLPEEMGGTGETIAE